MALRSAFLVPATPTPRLGSFAPCAARRSARRSARPVSTSLGAGTAGAAAATTAAASTDAATTGNACVVLCPGQGAQFVGQGHAWYSASEAARRVFARADKYLGKSRLPGNRSVSSVCFEGPRDALDRTDVAQPAIFVTSLACWAALRDELGYVAPDAPPGSNGARRDGDGNGGGGGAATTATATAGLSLGEYTALTLAGAIEFEAALELVTLRGHAMQRAAENSRGGMVALLGATEEHAAQVCRAVSTQREVLVPANFNAPGQVVVSGAKEACDRAVAYATNELRLKATALPVAGAFHSPLMQPAADEVAEALRDTHIETPLRAAVMSNVSGAPHARDDANAIRARLVEQLTAPVRWAACVKHLSEAFGGGESGAAAAQFIELAPGKTLAGLVKRIERQRTVIGYDAPPSMSSSSSSSS